MAAGKAPTALRAGRLHRRVVNARRWPPGAALVHTAAAAGKAPTALRAGRSIVGRSTQGVGHRARPWSTPQIAAGKAPTALRAGRIHRRVVNAWRWPPGGASVATAMVAGSRRASPAWSADSPLDPHHSPFQLPTGMVFPLAFPAGGTAHDLRPAAHPASAERDLLHRYGIRRGGHAGPDQARAGAGGAGGPGAGPG